MNSEVLDISSPYPLASNHNASRSPSPSSLGSRRKSIEEAREGTSWKQDESTLSRKAGANISKVSSDESTMQRDSTTTEEKDWHPLHSDGHDAQDTPVVVDLGDSIVDSSGRLLFADNSAKSSPAPSRRTSGIKPGPSPPPWEVIQPPSNNGHRDYGGGAKILKAPHSKRLVPKSSYYSGPPASDSAYGTMPIGQIGIHHPREIIRIERDYSGGDIIQFAPIYPLELEGRVTPTQFLESINAINERLIDAHSLRMSMLENVFAVLTLYLSRLVVSSHYDKEMWRLKTLFEELNTELYNPAGLNMIWPGDVAFLFLEIEYY